MGDKSTILRPPLAPIRRYIGSTTDTSFSTNYTGTINQTSIKSYFAWPPFGYVTYKTCVRMLCKERSHLGLLLLCSQYIGAILRPPLVPISRYMEDAISDFMTSSIRCKSLMIWLELFIPGQMTIKFSSLATYLLFIFLHNMLVNYFFVTEEGEFFS